MDDLVDAVGVDAARYALIRSSVDSTLDVDLDLSTRRSNDNPVFYVQYAHARLASLARNAADLGHHAPGDGASALLEHPREGDLIRTLGEFPAVVASAAELREPHRVARYLESLASAYHKFYDSCRVLPMGDEEITELHRARLALCVAARQVLANGLALLGVSAPRSGCDAEGAPGRAAARRNPGRRRQTAGAATRADAAELDALAPGGVAAQRRPRPRTAPCDVAGVDVRDLAERVRHPAVRARRGRLPVPRRRVRRRVRRRRRCTTRPRRSCAPRSPAGSPTRACRWTCAAAASWRWRCAPGFPAERIALHGNNKSVRRAGRRGRGRASAGWCSTRSTRSPGWTRSPASAASSRR